MASDPSDQLARYRAKLKAAGHAKPLIELLVCLMHLSLEARFTNADAGRRASATLPPNKDGTARYHKLGPDGSSELVPQRVSEDMSPRDKVTPPPRALVDAFVALHGEKLSGRNAQAKTDRLYRAADQHAKRTKKGQKAAQPPYHEIRDELKAEKTKAAKVREQVRELKDRAKVAADEQQKLLQRYEKLSEDREQERAQVAQMIEVKDTEIEGLRDRVAALNHDLETLREHVSALEGQLASRIASSERVRQDLDPETLAELQREVDRSPPSVVVTSATEDRAFVRRTARHAADVVRELDELLDACLDLDRLVDFDAASMIESRPLLGSASEGLPGFHPEMGEQAAMDYYLCGTLAGVYDPRKAPLHVAVLDAIVGCDTAAREAQSFAGGLSHSLRRLASKYHDERVRGVMYFSLNFNEKFKALRHTLVDLDIKADNRTWVARGFAEERAFKVLRRIRTARIHAMSTVRQLQADVDELLRYEDPDVVLINMYDIGGPDPFPLPSIREDDADEVPVAGAIALNVGALSAVFSVLYLFVDETPLWTHSLWVPLGLLALVGIGALRLLFGRSTARLLPVGLVLASLLVAGEVLFDNPARTVIPDFDLWRFAVVVALIALTVYAVRRWAAMHRGFHRGLVKERREEREILWEHRTSDDPEWRSKLESGSPG